MFRKNINFKGTIPKNSWRKIAINTWDGPESSVIHARVELNPTPALEYIDKLNAKNNSDVTLTHYVAKVLGLMLQEFPELNSLLRGKKIYQREDADVFFHVSHIDETGKENLSGHVIRRANEKSVLDISSEVKREGGLIKKGDDKGFEKLKSLFGGVPDFFLNTVVRFTTFLQYRLNLWSPLIGSKQDSFGSIMVTNIGSLGIDEAFVPFAYYAPVHAICSLGAVVDRPVIKDGVVVPGKRLTTCWSMDHRIFDGSLGSKMVKFLRENFENPSLIEELDSQK